MSRTRSLSLIALAAVTALAACSDSSATSPVSPSSPTLAKSGTTSGGGGGGGSTGAPSIPVVPSFTARIDSIGIVPTGVYYGTPSEWTVGGYIFEGNYFTHLKALAGPLVVGACVSVTFSEPEPGHRVASEIKSEQSSKCP
ncbi:MAG: hypothetical protein ABI625_07760 [bacterium]